MSSFEDRFCNPSLVLLCIYLFCLELDSFTLYTILIQISSQVAQSVLLGNLTGYFTIEEPTAEDTRNAYLYALGKYVTFTETVA